MFVRDGLATHAWSKGGRVTGAREAQDPLVLWGLTDRRRYFPPAVAVSGYLALSAAAQLVAGFRAGADSLLDEHAREALYLLRCEKHCCATAVWLFMLSDCLPFWTTVMQCSLCSTAGKQVVKAPAPHEMSQLSGRQAAGEQVSWIADEEMMSCCQGHNSWLAWVQEWGVPAGGGSRARVLRSLCLEPRPRVRHNALAGSAGGRGGADPGGPADHPRGCRGGYHHGRGTVCVHAPRV